MSDPYNAGVGGPAWRAQQKRITRNDPTHGEGGWEKPDTSGVVERLKRAFRRRVSGAHTTYGPLQSAIFDALALIQSQRQEIDSLLDGMREIAEEKFRTVGELRAIATRHIEGAGK